MNLFSSFWDSFIQLALALALLCCALGMAIGALSR
jgi:hypothetical protein